MFGTVNNNNVSQSPTDNQITITFTVVIIDNGQSNQTSMLITAGAEYFNQTEIWIGQITLVYNKVNVSESLSNLSFGSIVPAIPTTEIGKFGYFYVPLSVYGMRYFNMNITGQSNTTKISICSIHIMVF
jgi:hypothetical protein